MLRDIEGAVHVFPNGAINTLANRSKDFSYYVIDVAVSYYDDTDRVAEVLREVAAELQRTRCSARRSSSRLRSSGSTGSATGRSS